MSGIENGVYFDAVTGQRANVTNHYLEFFVQANSAGIYVLDGPGKIGADGPYLRLVGPAGPCGTSSL